MMKQEWIFGQNEMVFLNFVYGIVFIISWGVYKNWPRKESTTHMRKVVIWSPFFRIIMMLWFTTCLWTLTYLNGEVLKGFEEENLNLENPRVKGKGNNLRMLVGLDTRYPTQVKTNDTGMMLQAAIKLPLLIVFPVLTYIWLQKNYDYLDLASVRVKFGTLYTDYKP